MADQHPPTYFVVFHTPGAKWLPGIPYDKQPDFGKHVGYMQELFDSSKVALSGPFLEGSGGMASGGMLILKGRSLDEALADAMGDPTVKSGMLQVEVKPWAVVFHP